MTARSEEPLLFSDLSLAQRLERAEGRSCAAFVESRARLFPDSGAQWIEVAGAYCMCDGAVSPLTQTFGLGLFQPVTAVEMELIEKFYRDRGAPVLHEVSPLADVGLLGLLNERGYHPIELTTVMFRSIARGIESKAARNEDIHVRLAAHDEGEIWAQTAVKGWIDETEHAASMIELMLVSTNRSGALSFLAEFEGQPIATGALCISDGVALLAGASTIPEGRNRGAQLALLDSRLRYAAEKGCDIAMMGARPGSASQRNAERQGFHIAYTRIKWQLAVHSE
jgi:hypothetical protein